MYAYVSSVITKFVWVVEKLFIHSDSSCEEFYQDSSFLLQILRLATREWMQPRQPWP